MLVFVLVLLYVSFVCLLLVLQWWLINVLLKCLRYFKAKKNAAALHQAFCIIDGGGGEEEATTMEEVFPAQDHQAVVNYAFGKADKQWNNGAVAYTSVKNHV